MAQAFDLGQLFFLEFSPNYVFSRVIKDFVMTVSIKLKIDTMQTRFPKNLVKFVLWPGPYKMLISVLPIRKASVSRY